MAPRPIYVELNPCAHPGFFFVMIRGVYGTNGLVVGHARPLDRAERLKEAVERQLHAFGQILPLEGESSPTATTDIWDRLVQGDEF